MNKQSEWSDRQLDSSDHESAIHALSPALNTEIRLHASISDSGCAHSPSLL